MNIILSFLKHKHKLIEIFGIPKDIIRQSRIIWSSSKDYMNISFSFYIMIGSSKLDCHKLQVILKSLSNFIYINQ